MYHKKGDILQSDEWNDKGGTDYSVKILSV